MSLKNDIKKLVQEKNAIILAHNYQPEEIQKIADYTGDSLELAKIAAKTNASIIVFCGVYFMAESAFILNPDKKVILPELDAKCPMAQMAPPEKINDVKAQHPGAKVVCYINTNAATKSVSDVCCTSSNAVKIVQNLDCEKIIFVPDKNLGSFVSKFTEKEIILWDGYCPIHNNRTAKELISAKEKHPDAKVIIHPECPEELRALSDEILSTGGMVEYCKNNTNQKIIVATENGMLYKLQSGSPQNTYIEMTSDFICEDMKKITLEKVYNSLSSESPVVTVPKEIADNAYRCLDEMLKMSI